MYGTYLRLDVTVHDGWRAVIRAAARKLAPHARRDPPGNWPKCLGETPAMLPKLNAMRYSHPSSPIGKTRK